MVGSKNYLVNILYINQKINNGSRSAPEHAPEHFARAPLRSDPSSIISLRSALRSTLLVLRSAPGHSQKFCSAPERSGALMERSGAEHFTALLITGAVHHHLMVVSIWIIVEFREYLLFVYNTIANNRYSDNDPNTGHLRPNI